jgi:ribonuclease HIII
MNSATITYEGTDWDSVADFFDREGLSKQHIKTDYEVFRYKGEGLTVVAYSSGKILMQGKDVSEDFKELTSYINGLDGKSSKQIDFKPHMGVDEVGKGDYFGPMVAASAYVTEENFELLDELGVLDSKKISDARIVDIFNEVNGLVEYSVKVLKPAEYNEEIRKIGNVSILLAKMHAEVIEDLLTDLKHKDTNCKEVVIDQFSKVEDRVTRELGELGRQVDFKQFHRGERDPAVAVASVIARAVFLAEWSNMERKYDFRFPKGASSVIRAGKKFVADRGEDSLKNVAKVSFRTTEKVLGDTLY